MDTNMKIGRLMRCYTEEGVEYKVNEMLSEVRRMKAKKREAKKKRKRKEKATKRARRRR